MGLRTTQVGRQRPHGQTHATRRGAVRAGAVGVALAGALTLAACGGGGGSGGSTTGGPAPVTSGGGMASGRGASEVEVHQGSLGSYLTDSQGNTLYLFAKDPTGKSSCSGSCAAAWPPFTAQGKAEAGSGIDGAKLTTITRDDGSKQVAYDGHALYYFVKDAKAGDTTGQGVDGFGALWWVVAPSGSAITSMASGGSSPSPSDDSGYTY
ncbi:COG4315 family predicted lipoprotein [Luteimicrobium sp. DT211]|uniref:COG4315 family predicted lipoprotein n=1 Tax=Luteimicrobium sp. DT211 TaxID=3393412 RepID=UPI003CF8652D